MYNFLLREDSHKYVSVRCWCSIEYLFFSTLSVQIFKNAKTNGVTCMKMLTVQGSWALKLYIYKAFILFGNTGIQSYVSVCSRYFIDYLTFNICPYKDLGALNQILVNILTKLPHHIKAEIMRYSKKC